MKEQVIYSMTLEGHIFAANLKRDDWMYIVLHG